MRILITALVASMAACGGPSAPGASPHRDGEFDRGASQKALGAVDITACRGLAGPSGRCACSENVNC